MRVYHWKSNGPRHFPSQHPFSVFFFLFPLFLFSFRPFLSFGRARRSIRIKIAVGPVRGRNPRVPDRESKNGNRGLISIRPYHFRFAIPSPCHSPPTCPYFPSLSFSRSRHARAPCRNTSRAETRISIKQSFYPSVSSLSAAHKRGRLPRTRGTEQRASGVASFA
jgi:hypothetical protein